jgi:hypothetical protein
MASPFRVFRKNQKAMLAVLGILVMLSFVFGDMIMQLVGASRVRNPVIVSTTKFGDLKINDLQHLSQRHGELIQIWQRILGEHFGVNNPELYNSYIQRSFGGTTEEEVVNSWLIAKYAEKMGIRISDETIYRFLDSVPQAIIPPNDPIYFIFRNLPSKKLKSKEFQQILNEQKMTKNYFFDLMRGELAKRQLMILHNLSVQGLTPAQRWDYYCRANRKATIECVALPVERFVGQVKNEPTQAELEAFFKQYKAQTPKPDSPDPGFTEPKKIDVAYFEADMAAFSTPQTVSDEEIQTQYETDPKRYGTLDREYKISAELKKAAEKNKSETTPPQGKTEDKKPENPPVPAPSAESKAPAPGAAAAAPPEQPAAGTVNPPPAKTPEPPAKENPAPQNPPKTSATGSGVFHLASLKDDQTPAASDAKPAASDAKPAAPAERANEKSLAAEPALPQTKEQPKPAATPQLPLPETKTVEPARPLRDLTPEVRDIIRREVEEKKTQEAAIEKIRKAFNELRQVMMTKGHEWDRYEAADIRGEKVKKPTPLDFPGLAKKYGCTSGQTGLVNRWEIEQWPIAQSRIQAKIQLSQPEVIEREGSLFTPYAFDNQKMSFRTALAASPDGQKRFLFWMTEVIPEKTPELADPGVREKVLRAWRVVQARDLAKKEANRLAEEARKTKASLQEAFAGQSDLKVLTPPAFSWYTSGNLPNERQTLKLSDVQGIPIAGDDFLRTVFALEKEETGVAMNQPETDVYVVRVTKYDPSMTVLWAGFLAESETGFNQYAGAATDDMIRMTNAWLNELRKDAGLEKHQLPQQPQQREHPEPKESQVPIGV